MTRKYYLLAMILLPVAVHALSLNEARSMARDNFPAIRQYRMIEQSRDFTLDNVAKGWLPQVSISVGAYGFTDILKSDPKIWCTTSASCSGIKSGKCRWRNSIRSRRNSLALW